MVATWKKLLLEGDSIPAQDVIAGEFGPGNYTISGCLAVPVINEYDEGGGVTIAGVTITQAGIAAPVQYAHSISEWVPGSGISAQDCVYLKDAVVLPKGTGSLPGGSSGRLFYREDLEELYLYL